METGKTTKYLKYAIGEIFLVVIGILIALQINNWNEVRKAKVLEQSYYCLLLEEIEQDKEQVLDLKTLTQERINGANTAIQEIQKDKTDLGVFGKSWLIAIRLNNRTFRPNDGTYLDIKSSGNLNIIKDKQIIQRLNKYLKNVNGYTETIVSNVGLEQSSINSIDNLFNTGFYQASMDSFYTNDVFTESIREKLKKDLPVYISATAKPKLYSAVVLSGINKRRRLELLSLIENEVDNMKKLLQQKCNIND